MGTYIAKIKKNDSSFFKLKDQVENEDYNNINLDDAIIYDPNNDMAHQWFKIQHFSTSESFLDLFNHTLDSANLTDLSNENYSHIEFIALHSNNKFYIQKVTTSTYMSKKFFSFNGEVVNYESKSDMIFLNPIPNCIYDHSTDCLYFMDIAKAYGVFKNLKNDYRDATSEEIQSFLSSDIINCVDFDQSKVGILNRKNIAKLLSIYNNYSTVDKNILRSYISTNVGENLVFDPHTGKFNISNDNELKLLLYGLMMRYYTPPLNNEVQVATNTTKISNILG